MIIWTFSWHLKWCGGQSCRTEPLTCRIWYYLQVDSFRIELNWCPRIGWVGNHPRTLEIGCRNFLLSIDTSFVGYHSVYLGKCPVYIWEARGFCCCWVGLCMSIWSSWFIVLCNFSVSLFIFCLVVLLIIVSGVLKSPTIIMELPIFPFNSVGFCFTYFDGLSLGAEMFIIVISSCCIEPFINI